jgi:hypothetical protein
MIGLNSLKQQGSIRKISLYAGDVDRSRCRCLVNRHDEKAKAQFQMDISQMPQAFQYEWNDATTRTT